MAEYIDREALYQFLTDQKRKETGAYSKGINAGLNVARSALHNKEITPSADVAPVKHVKLVEYAPVVRCKDCKYYVSYWDANCCDIFCDGQEEPYPTNPTDFCSYGERKEEHE